MKNYRFPTTNIDIIFLTYKIRQFIVTLYVPDLIEYRDAGTTHQ